MIRAGSPQIDVVGVEPVGHAAEPADVLQGEEEARRAGRSGPARARPRVTPVAAIARELGVDQVAGLRRSTGRAGGSTVTPKLPASSRPDW